jgi:hypothetical protein
MEAPRLSPVCCSNRSAVSSSKRLICRLSLVEGIRFIILYKHSVARLLVLLRQEQPLKVY